MMNTLAYWIGTMMAMLLIGYIVYSILKPFLQLLAGVLAIFIVIPVYIWLFAVTVADWIKDRRKPREAI